MTTRFPCLNIVGGLFASDLIDQIIEGIAPGQKPADFKLSPRTYLTDEIAAAWTDARSLWTTFQHRLERLSPEDIATSTTRDQWIIPLLSLLGYELSYVSRAAEVDGLTYAISHRAGQDENAPPVHIVGCRQSLDRRPESGRPRLAPHSLLQEYINRTEHLWGVVTNGYTLRLLRDSQLIRRQAYIEFDLKQMMESEKFSDFALLFRLVHCTRLPHGLEDATQCLLEQYYAATIQQGGRVRDHLRDGVEEALKIFANGFLHHFRNQDLRDRVTNKKLNPHFFYQQLLRLIYRILFLMVSEERNLITENPYYRNYYSISRLRQLAELRSSYSEHEDFWMGLRTTFRLFQDEKLGNMLGAPPLNGDLFDTSQTPDLTDAALSNRNLLTAIWHLSMYHENEKTPWRRINYAALDVEELGSVYESLLDFQPVFIDRNGKCLFDLAYGMERKSTGSYYTPPELVNELIKSALVPVLEERLKEVKTAQEKEKTILNLKVCDPASGSGHFLLAAARKLGRELAKVRTGDDEPAPEQMRLAIRDVITHCIYAVDKNPLAVDLCKVALWMEGHAKGKPLTFLDHRIRCGDSLVGVLDLKVLEQGIPNEAFEPVIGDDKQVARSLKKQNRVEREGQRSISFEAKKEMTSLLDAYQPLRELPDDTPEQIRRKVEAYQKIQSHGSKWWQDNTACHLWTAAFFTELSQENNKNNRIPTTETLRRYLETYSTDGRQIGNAWALAQKYHFFHWPLEFPEVFEQGGFNVILGNPPWERIKLQEKEFFDQRDPEIAGAPNAAARKLLIEALPSTKPSLWKELVEAKRAAESGSDFIRNSGRYRFSKGGEINTYVSFVELKYSIIRPRGYVGCIVPSGVATDETNKELIQELLLTKSLVSFFDFTNRGYIFLGTESTFSFSLLTLSKTINTKILLAAQIWQVEHLRDRQRVYSLTDEEISKINPNTLNLPILRSTKDAQVVKAIYSENPILVREVPPTENPWHVSFLSMFHMTNDSYLFRTKEDLESDGWTLTNGIFIKGENQYLPLYEAKLVHMFNHRAATFYGIPPREMFGTRARTTKSTEIQLKDPNWTILPRYWIPKQQADERTPKNWQYMWFMGFRNAISAVADARSVLFTIFPKYGVGNSLPLLFAKGGATDVAFLLGNFNSFVFDYVTKQKASGGNLNFYILKQLPILSPDKYRESDSKFILPRILELTYTSWDLTHFAKDCGYDGPPFHWDAERRFLIRCELEAWYFHLYDIARDDLIYIMETFPIVKRSDEERYGEYRTMRVVSECYDAMELAKETGEPYKTILDTPPADSRIAHIKSGI